MNDIKIENLCGIDELQNGKSSEVKTFINRVIVLKLKDFTLIQVYPIFSNKFL